MKHYGLAIGLIATSLYASACNGAETTSSGVPSSSDLEIGSQEPPADPQQTCDAAKVQWAIGKAATEDLLERARNESGAEVARILRPGLSVTQEFMYGRLNLDVDESNVVTAVSCW